MSAKPAKLSPAMQHVLDRMDEGWTLNQSTANRMGYHAWLSQSGAALEHLPRHTVYALLRRGLLVWHYEFPVGHYTRAASGGPGGDHD